MHSLFLAAWTIREWLSVFTLFCLIVIPIVAMWRFFVKGSDEQSAK